MIIFFLGILKPPSTLQHMLRNKSFILHYLKNVHNSFYIYFYAKMMEFDIFICI